MPRERPGEPYWLGARECGSAQLILRISNLIFGKKMWNMARRKLWKGVLAGGAAGLAGTLAMSKFRIFWGKVSEKLTTNDGANISGEQAGEESEDATMKAAGKIAELAGRPLSHEDKQKAGPFLHYGFGTTMGLVYGTLMEIDPRDLRHHDLLFHARRLATILAEHPKHHFQAIS